MDNRLLAWSATFIAVFANVGTIVLLVKTAHLDSLWPVLVTVVAVIAAIAILIFGSRIRSHKSASPTPLPDVDLAPSQSTDQTIEAIASNGVSLGNKPLMKLIEECVFLFEELVRLHPSLDASSQEFADHLSCRLQEILERSGVTVISGDAVFDPHRHQQESADGLAAEGGKIVETQSPGFAVGRRVFRRARVKLAEAASAEKGKSP